MKILKFGFIGALFCVLAISCSKDEVNSNSIEITGILQEQGITTYQYGTHTLPGFALRSSIISLDDYVNQPVTVVGNKIEGYPIEGGPEYLEVVEIK